MTIPYPQSTDDSHELIQQRAYPDLASIRQALDAQAAEIELLTAELQTYRQAGDHPDAVSRLVAKNLILTGRVQNALEALEAINSQNAITLARQELLKAQEGR